MKFARIVGKPDPAAVRTAEDRLTTAFTELSVRYDNPIGGLGMGGDPFLFTLMYPVEQICTDAIPTAGTDGKRFFWNPEFVNGLTRIGLRIVIAHEAFHAIYMHPARRGSRIAWLWNVAVDYIVNNNVMVDFKARGLDAERTFRDNIGNFLTLTSYADLLSGKVKGKAKDKFYFADPELPEKLRKPETIYEFLYNQIPKCPKCGKLAPEQAKTKGKSDKDESDNGKSDKDGKGKQKGKQQPGGKQKGKQPGNGSKDPNGQPSCGHDHDHGESGDCSGDDSGQGDGQNDQDGEGSGEGCNHEQPLGGALVDEHMDSEATQEELAKRLASAAEISQRLAGKIPAGMADEIGHLLAPKLRWQDVIRSKIQRVRQGHGRNDWNRFRSRPMFAGLMIPKRREFFAKFHCLLDTSGSMSGEDMTWGISQLQALDERGEGTITPADAQIYWDSTVKITKANKEELSKVKVVGRGGTMFCGFFDEYEERLGPADFLVIITDGYLLDGDIAAAKKPKCNVFWLLTASHSFTPDFGKVLDFRNNS